MNRFHGPKLNISRSNMESSNYCTFYGKSKFISKKPKSEYFIKCNGEKKIIINTYHSIISIYKLQISINNK